MDRAQRNEANTHGSRVAGRALGVHRILQQKPVAVLAGLALVVLGAAAVAMTLRNPPPHSSVPPRVRTSATQPGPSSWSVSYPSPTQGSSTPWQPGPDPNGPDPDGNGLDARGCPYPNPYPDIVSDRDEEAAKADPDPRVLACSIDRR